MAEKTVLKAIRYLGKCLEEDGLDISRIILFGSQAAGCARADSDIDIVVISADFEGRDIFQRAAMLRRARLKTIDKYLLPMDIVLKTPAEYQDGIISLYADKGAVVFNSSRTPKRKKTKVPA